MKRINQSALIVALIFCITDYALCSSWVSAELCVIEWGPEENQLMLTEKAINDPGTPEDSTDDYIEPVRGPHIAIVDVDENIIIGSFESRQLKGFSNSADLIFDFSYDGDSYDSDIFKYAPFAIYVDEIPNLYVQSDPGNNSIPVVDYNGEIIEQIRPFAQDPDATIDFMWNAPDGSLFAFNEIYGWITYKEGISTSGGSTGFLAADGSFYTVTKKTANSLEFKRFENPDSTTLAETRELTEVPVEVDTLVAAGLINGGDGNNLYVILAINEYFYFEIWQFDLEYNVIDKLVLTNEEPYEGLGISPFIRDDGNIYEFLSREDGLHVIRWSKE